MGRKIKEEEKIEKAIRAFIRLPENRRCINCDSLGPQYVCITFWTFICTTCSGIHREFTHRVKSISMARFSAEEVSALEAAGNERARQLYFKGWDPESHTLPDGSNIHRLRDFIKHVYVDRLYTGERGQISLPSVRTRLKASESRSSSIFDNKDKLSYGERFNPLMKAYQGSFRGFTEERNTSSRRGTPRFEVVDHRFREDASGSSKGSSPRAHKDVGEDGRSSKLGEHSNAKAQKDFYTSSDSQISSSTDAAKQMVTLESLIDFSDDFEPSADAGNPSKEKEEMASSANTLEFLLFGLSGTDVVPSTPPAQTMPISASQNSSTIAGAKDVLLQPCDASNADSEGLQLAVAPQYHTSAASAPDSSFTSQGGGEQFTNSGGQPSHVPQTHNVPSSAMAEQPYWAISNSGVDNSFAVRTDGGRKELHADLFTGRYMSGAAVSGWQAGQWHSMWFNQPYHPHLMSISSFPNASRSTNPFDDYICEPCPAQPTAVNNLGASMGEAVHTGVPPSRSKETGAIGGDIFGSRSETSRSTGGNPFW